MIKKITIITLLIFSLFNLAAAETLIDKADIVINQWLDNKITNSEFISEIQRLETTATTIKEKTIINLYVGLGYFEDENKKQSLKALEEGLKNSEIALQSNNESETWRIDAELRSYTMLQKGISYIIKNSQTVSDNAQKALDLDPKNARASLIVAQGLINAPALFGGDIKKGIKILEELTKRANLKKEDIFFIYTSLSGAYEKNKKKDLAVTAIENALKIYPNNKKAIETLGSLKR